MPDNIVMQENLIKHFQNIHVDFQLVQPYGYLVKYINNNVFPRIP